jgi:hypothetical protein
MKRHYFVLSISIARRGFYLAIFPWAIPSKRVRMYSPITQTLFYFYIAVG